MTAVIFFVSAVSAALVYGHVNGMRVNGYPFWDSPK